MAIDSTNSTTVSILNLPSAQLALETDKLILQTDNGTQIITFNDFNVVKTDLYGNATVLGSLTGNDALLTTLTLKTLSAESYTSNGKTGVNKSMSYYNRVEVTNGVVTSAAYVTGSPEYQSLLTTIRSTSSTNVVYEQTGTAVFQQGASASNTVSITVPSEIGGLIKPYHIYLTPYYSPSVSYAAYSYMPRIQSFTYNANTNILSFVINSFEVQSAAAGNLMYWRLVYNY